MAPLAPTAHVSCLRRRLLPHRDHSCGPTLFRCSLAWRNPRASSPSWKVASPFQSRRRSALPSSWSSRPAPPPPGSPVRVQPLQTPARGRRAARGSSATGAPSLDLLAPLCLLQDTLALLAPPCLRRGPRGAAALLAEAAAVLVQQRHSGLAARSRHRPELPAPAGGRPRVRGGRAGAGPADASAPGSPGGRALGIGTMAHMLHRPSGYVLAKSQPFTVPQFLQDLTAAEADVVSMPWADVVAQPMLAAGPAVGTAGCLRGEPACSQIAQRRESVKSLGALLLWRGGYLLHLRA